MHFRFILYTILSEEKMIAKLTGIIDSVFDGFLILDVSGVGYRVFCSAKTAMKMPPKGQTATLWIETHVREDHIHLFGFADTIEQQSFILLTGVQGVGSRVALAILSALSPSDIQMAVMTGDSKAFTRASGVGPKLGTRLVTELKGKLGSLGTNETMVISGFEEASGSTSTVLNETISALVNLGYSRTEAGITVSAILKDNQTATTPELIRLALKEIGKQNG